MSIHRRNAKRDVTEPDIIAALEARGCFVRRISGEGVPDLLVLYKCRWRLLECKSPTTAKGTEAQLKFAQDVWFHNGPITPNAFGPGDVDLILKRWDVEG